MQSSSLPMLMISGFGVGVIATTILGDFGLTPLGKWTLRLLGILLVGIGLIAA